MTKRRLKGERFGIEEMPWFYERLAEECWGPRPMTQRQKELWDWFTKKATRRP